MISENLPPDNDPIKKEKIRIFLEAIAQNVKNFTIEKRLKTILVLKEILQPKRKKRNKFYQKFLVKTLRLR